MNKIIFSALLLIAVLQILPAQEETSGKVIPEDQTGNITDEARELILFDNDGFIFGSYMRVGLHENVSANMIEGAGMWNVENGYNGMRFMNEGNYNEWLLGYESPRDQGSWWGGAYFRVAFDIPEFAQGWSNLSEDDYGIILPEAFFRLGFAGQKWNLWLGRRYNEKVAINMMDYYVANLDGNGIGMEGIDIGAATLDINWLYSYNDGQAVGEVNDDISELFTYPGKNTLGLVIRGLDAGPGDFNFIVSPSFQSGGDVATDVDDSTGNVDDTTYYPYGGGGFLAVKYVLSDFFGMNGGNEFYASGGFGTGANQHADTDLDNYATDDYSVLVGMQGYALVTDSISWRATVHYEHRNWQTNKNFMSLGFRPLFRVAPIFGIQLEYDFEAAFDTGQYVNRFTFAPTFLPRNGNTTSPLQVMAYVTYGYGDFTGEDNIAVSPGSKHGFTWGFFGNVGF